MNTIRFILISTAAIALSRSSGFGQQSKHILYKQIDTIQLYMDVYSPVNMDTSISLPAMVFFFGGGWNSGTTEQFEPHAKYFANRGMVCFLADYRVNKRHGTSPFESLEDARSAIRYIRRNASMFHVDTSRIVAAGGSAGGHLAAAAAMTTGFNEENDEAAVSSVPDALVLFNPVIDNGPGGYGYDRIGESYKDFSPLHNIRSGAPPVIFFLGTEDRLIPVETARYFKTVMEKVGSRCDLFLFEGEGHGFFNLKRSVQNYTKTVYEADRFLISLGYLGGEPTIGLISEPEGNMESVEQ